MWNSCACVIPNICAWEQQEWNNTKKNRGWKYEESEYGKKYSGIKKWGR